jgi:hypothetical protein
MKLSYWCAQSCSARPLSGTLLLLLTAVVCHAQAPANRRLPGQQAQVQQAPVQQANAQPFAMGEAVEIQASNGSWIAGNIRNFDPATGKYEVVLVNSMSGWALPNSLRRGTANPQIQAAPVAAVPVPAAAPQFNQPFAGAVPVAGQTGQVQAAPSICGGQAMCMETRSFAAVITDFRLSTSGAWRIVDATLRFVNKTGTTLALGYVNQSGGIIDDQGNRFVITNDATIRGIGVIQGNAPDPKFVLQPGESGDTQFQFGFAHRQEILGTAFELGLTVRELTLVGVGQYRPGPEYPLHFLGLGQTSITGPAPMTTQGPSAPQLAAPGTPVTQAMGAPGVPPAQAGAAPNAAQAGRGRAGMFSGLSQAAGMIPGFGKGQAAGTTPGTAGQTTSNIASQIASAGSAFTGAAAQPNGTAAAPGQPAAASGGGAASFLSQAANVIPGFSGGSAGSTASNVMASAASMIPGFSGAPAASPQPAAVGAAPGMPVPAAIAAPAVGTDPCASQAHCFNAGTFAAYVNQVNGVNGPKGYTVHTQLIFRNVGAQPVVLAYVPHSAVVADNLGNRFSPVINGAVEQGVAGMGAVGSPQAASFVLRPGQTRAVGLALVRPATVTSPVGASFNVSMQVSELSTASGQIVPVRQDGVVFANVACQACAAVAPATAAPAVAAPVATTAAAAAANNPANALRNALKKK